MPDTCGNCRFKLDVPVVDDNGDPATAAFCRRYPPAVLSTGNQSAYPPVSESRWCGEWQKVAGTVPHNRKRSSAR